MVEDTLLASILACPDPACQVMLPEPLEDAESRYPLYPMSHRLDVSPTTIR